MTILENDVAEIVRVVRDIRGVLLSKPVQGYVCEELARLKYADAVKERDEAMKERDAARQTCGEMRSGRGAAYTWHAEWKKATAERDAALKERDELQKCRAAWFKDGHEQQTELNEVKRERDEAQAKCGKSEAELCQSRNLARALKTGETLYRMSAEGNLARVQGLETQMRLAKEQLVQANEEIEKRKADLATLNRLYAELVENTQEQEGNKRIAELHALREENSAFSETTRKQSGEIERLKAQLDVAIEDRGTESRLRWELAQEREELRRKLAQAEGALVIQANKARSLGEYNANISMANGRRIAWEMAVQKAARETRAVNPIVDTRDGSPYGRLLNLIAEGPQMVEKGER